MDSFSLMRIALALAFLWLLPACSTTGKLKRTDRSKECSCDLDQASIGVLLEHALRDPESHHSTHALAYFIEKWQEEHKSKSEGVVEIKTPDGKSNRVQVSFRGVHLENPLAEFDTISPAYAYQVKGLKHYSRQGIGAPLLALRENQGRESTDAFYTPSVISRPLTAVLSGDQRTKEGRKVRIDLYSPFQTDQISHQGRKRDLAVDFTVPWAAVQSKTSSLKRSQLFDFPDSDKANDPRLFLLEPYDPNKEPLIMIHGLLESPLIWAELTNTLWADEQIRTRYQIWHFFYNTSAPALYSGRVLRNQLRKVRGMLDPDENDPAMQSTTIIAHSMGGIITRTLLTRPGNAYWDAAFTQSFESLKLSEKDRASLKEAFFWEATPHVKRVIYIAASHRGSTVADNLIGRFGGLLAKPPKDGFRDFYDRITAANPGSFKGAYKELGEGKHNSIHALSPRHPTLIILAKLPNIHPVREFSIIGNEGKPGPLEESSDGIVPYWSSHIDWAESEKIVPTGHFAFKHPETVAEVKRVLKLP